MGGKKERARQIHQILDELFPEPKIPLLFQDPYTLLIATLLSAQCTDAKVNQVTCHLFAKATTPSQMILLSVEEIQKIIRPCGLYKAKSRAIWQLSQDLLTHHLGQVPSDLDLLKALPGVGHKTASVVLIHAFHTPAFPVDTHIHRCAARWGLSSGKSVEQTEKDLKSLFPQLSWAKVHLQIIYFARTYCPARGHNPQTCPICFKICRNN